MGRGIYTADMGQPPQEPDDASAGMGMRKAPMAKENAMMRRDGRNAAKAAMQKKATPRGIRGGVWTEDSGVPVPQDIDGASAKPFKKGGSVGSASKRADGIAKRGKTRGIMC